MRKAICTFSSTVVLILALTTSAMGQLTRPAPGPTQPVPDVSYEFLRAALSKSAKGASNGIFFKHSFDQIKRMSDEDLVYNFRNKGIIIMDPQYRHATRYVSVEMQAVQGPYGEVYNPSTLASTLNNVSNDEFLFPSIIFKISVAQFIQTIPKQTDDQVYVISDVKHKDRNAK